jgi:hypothetical protein
VLFFLALVKDDVYRKKLQNINELCGRIIRDAECVTNETLATNWQENEYSPDVCRVTNGDHIEIY